MKQQKCIRVAQIVGKWCGGGVEAVLMNYYRHIDRERIQFDFICDSDSTCIPYAEIEQLGGRVIIIPPYQKPVTYHIALKRILKEEEYSIVHSHLTALSAFPLFAALCARVPYRIAHSHIINKKKQGGLLETKRYLTRQIFKGVSKAMANKYMSCSIDAGIWLFGKKEYEKGNVFRLHNAIEVEKFKYEPNIRQQLRQSLQITESTKVFGHIGRFVEQKNHDYLIDVYNDYLKDNKDSCLILIGEGRLLNTIKDKVKSLGIQDKVKFLGQRDNIWEWYQVFDVFVFPSLFEGLGMVLVESQLSGLRCISSSVIPKEAALSDNVTFLDLSDKSTWVAEMHKDVNKRESYIEQARNCGYDINIEASKLEQYYLEML